MNPIFDNFNDVFEKYLHNSSLSRNKNLLNLRAPEEVYEKRIEEFYKSLLDLCLYDVILLHYVAQHKCKLSLRNEIQRNLEDKALSKLKIINATTSEEQTLLDFCENFNKAYFGNENSISYIDSKHFTSNVCSYISENIYGFEYVSSNLDEIANVITEHIEAKKEKDVNGINFRYECADEMVPQILPCALLLYVDDIYGSAMSTVGRRAKLFPAYEKYIFSSFYKCHLLDNCRPTNAIIMHIFEQYCVYFNEMNQPYSKPSKKIQSLVYPPNKDASYLYTQEDLYNEALEIETHKCEYINEELISFSKEYKNVFDLFLKCVSKESFRSYKVTEIESFSNLVMGNIIFLYFSGNKKEAEKYLIKYYDDIGLKEKTTNWFFASFVRIIKDCEDYETASILLSLFIKDFVNTSENMVIAHTKQMVEYISEALKVAEKAYCDEVYLQKSYKHLYENVFKNDQFVEFFNKCKNAVKDNVILERWEFSSLTNIYTEFSKKNLEIDLTVLKDALGWDDLYYHDLVRKNNYDDKILCFPQFKFSFVDKYISEADFYTCRLYYADKNNIIKLISCELQGKVYKLQKEALFAEAKSFKKIKEQIEDNETDEALQKRLPEFENLSNLYGKSLMRISGIPSAGYTSMLDASQKAFLKEYTDTNSNVKLLVQKLPKDIAYQITEYITTAYMVYELLSDMSNVGAELDFSPACLPLTKSLEMMLGYIWKTAIEKIDITSINSNDQKFYCKGGAIKESLELGSYAKMFEKNWFIDASKKNNIINFDKLNNLNEKFYRTIELPIWDGQKLHFIKNNESSNRIAISKALSYVTSNYRNKAAHKDPFNKIDAEECRAYLISTQKLLWILLYMMKEYKAKEM